MSKTEVTLVEPEAPEAAPTVAVEEEQPQSATFISTGPLNDSVPDSERTGTADDSGVPADDNGVAADDMNPYKLRKNWKKSLSKVFRRGHRSTKSNEGEMSDDPSMHPDQKWQSLGKMFRRSSLVMAAKDQLDNPVGENSGALKRVTAIKSVFTKYLTKKPSFTTGPGPLQSAQDPLEVIQDLTYQNGKDSTNKDYYQPSSTPQDQQSF